MCIIKIITQIIVIYKGKSMTKSDTISTQVITKTLMCTYNTQKDQFLFLPQSLKRNNCRWSRKKEEWKMWTLPTVSIGVEKPSQLQRQKFRRAVQECSKCCGRHCARWCREVKASREPSIFNGNSTEISKIHLEGRKKKGLGAQIKVELWSQSSASPKCWSKKERERSHLCG